MRSASRRVFSSQRTQEYCFRASLVTPTSRRAAEAGCALLDCSAQPIPKRRVPLSFHALLSWLRNPVVPKGLKLAIYIRADLAGEFPVLFGYGKVLR